jgi:hypothetical protein
MACEKHAHLKYMRDMEMATWARYSHHENEHFRGEVSDRKAAQLAKQARERADAISKEMQRHRELCDRCKRGDSPLR